MSQTLPRPRFEDRAATAHVTRTGSLALYEQATSLLPIGAWSCDLHSDDLAWTGGVFDLFGLPRDAQVERRDIVGMYAEDSREILEQRRSRAIATRGGFTMDARIVRPDGRVRWMRITAATHVSNGRSRTLYGMKQDITEEHLRWEALRARAECDGLTGVANRARFQSAFLGQPRNAPVLAEVGALILLDMDGFKSVNDRWGHAAGDACLSAFARRLKAAFADATLVARIGGDEFAVLLPPIGARQAAEAAIRRKVIALHAPAEWDGHVLPLGVSAGLAFAEAAPDFDPQELFVAADRALYEAKRDPLAPLRRA
jgi:diguanylate cyclase (GGDEF)-like protein/PAS domain S-box-containing protein